MFDFADWYKEHENEFTREELRLFKEFIDGKISPELVAQSFIKNTNGTKGILCALNVKSETIISLAVSSLDSAIQEKLVNLVSEIRNIQKHSLDPKKKITYRTKIFRMEVIGEVWECKYFYLFLICLLILNANYNKLSSFLVYEPQP